MLAAARHVITSPVLLDVFLALRATLHCQAHDLLRVRLRRDAVVALRNPDMLAQEAHRRVEAKVTEADAARLRAIDLHGFRVQLVLRETAAPRQALLHCRDLRAELGEELPKFHPDAFLAIRVEAPHRHTALAHATVQALVGPTQPARDACRVPLASAARNVLEQCRSALAADGTDGAGVGRLRQHGGAEGVELGHLPVSGGAALHQREDPLARGVRLPVRRRLLRELPACDSDEELGVHWRLALGMATAQAPAPFFYAARRPGRAMR
mmetsp:Transcript_47673/g.94360  ORF Transcript_47673/g.94360 Transcript_47673/m.94360 type:complete len:268 (+) Transcript_47673:222-1025(+)